MLVDGSALLDKNGAAEFLSVSPTTLRRLTLLHDIKTKKLGRCQRWPVDELVRFINSM